MTEQELLDVFSGNYDAVSEPIECAKEFESHKKMLVRLGRVDSSQSPSTFSVYNVVYYVKDSGLETEEAYIAPEISNPAATAEIMADAAAAIAKKLES